MSEEKLRELIDAATGARDCALARYSNFCVGAAIEAEDGRVFTGCNIESAAYEQTICAERVAVWKALSEGVRKFRRIAVVVDTEHLTPPCGACRQILWEFCGDVPVILANPQGRTESLQMKDLLPRPFDSRFLDDSDAAEGHDETR